MTTSSIVSCAAGLCEFSSRRENERAGCPDIHLLRRRLRREWDTPCTRNTRHRQYCSGLERLYALVITGQFLRCGKQVRLVIGHGSDERGQTGKRLIRDIVQARQWFAGLIAGRAIGIDPGDAVALPKTAIVDGRLDTKRRKTAVPVWVKLPAPVTEALAAAPRHDAITLCATSRGKPWAYCGLDSGWRKARIG